MTVFGVGVLAISTYCGYLYTSYRRDVAASRSLTVPEDVSDRYNQTARSYDAEVEMGERLMRLGKRRKELVRMARGDVLEVSCGTGRNMQYYQLGERRGVDEKGKAEIQGCRSVTFVDLSPQMVEIARKKFEKLFPEFKRAAFQVQDAKEFVPPSPSSTAVVKSSPTAETIRSWTTSKPYFDTIIETMGLCSTPDPAGLLRHLGSITEPQHGRILLLEHGRSYYGWLNSILDNLAPSHANRHGCWWNRDIGEIVEQSGLEVMEVKRYHLGTTWRVILRPKLKDTGSVDEVKSAR
jgi:methyltransferase OMS1